MKFSFQWSILVVLVLLLGGLVYVVFHNPFHPKASAPACTAEAKLCPDGSSVGRIGPACEFAPCPKQETQNAIPDDWKTFSNASASFRYPETLGMQYTDTPDWPPTIAFEAKPFSCTEAGSLDEPGGKTESHTFHGHTYCVTERREGAAGSVYSLYAYAFASGERTATLTFSLRRAQCANYDELKKQDCENEQASLHLDQLMDQIASTVTVATDALSYKDVIRIETPTPGSSITTPLTVKGEARGNWYFEGSFPVVLTYGDGKIIAQTTAKATSDWMTDDYVPFTAELTFTPNTQVSDKGTLVLRKDNPSGAAANDDAFAEPIVFGK